MTDTQDIQVGDQVVRHGFGAVWTVDDISTGSNGIKYFHCFRALSSGGSSRGTFKDIDVYKFDKDNPQHRRVRRVRKTQRIRDTQRKKLYAAERAWWAKLDSQWTVNLDKRLTESYVRQITRSKWAKKYLTRPTFIEFGTTRHSPYIRSHYGATATSSPPTFGSTGWHRLTFYTLSSRAVILHEIAHLITAEIYHNEHGVRVASHGREYAKVYLSVVRRFFGKEAEAALKACLKEGKVKYTAARKAKSPASGQHVNAKDDNEKR